MRKNSRDHILSAALSVLDREGPGALTFEAISLESGLTKKGLIYHFSCRAELVDALHAHLAKRWDQEIAENVALPVVEPAERARHLAYVQACTHGASVHRLHFMLSGWKCPNIAARWLSVLEHWSPDTPARPDHHAAVRRFVARLACEGLKAHLSLASKPIDPSIRDAVAIEIAALMYPEIGGFELALSHSREAS